MKKTLAITLSLAFGLFFYLPSLSAQQCRGCTHAMPTQVYTSSTKNALTVLGPPDGKGKPVEYQIFTQLKNGTWTFQQSGIVEKPGARETFKYYQPTQIMVLTFCDTPFANMVEFSNIRVAAPDKPTTPLPSKN